MPPAVAAPRDRKLVAAGAMHLITGLLHLVSMVVVGLVDNGEAFLWLPVVAVFAAVPVVVGVGCIRGRRWGRVASIVVSSMALLVILPDMTLEDPAEGVIALAWFGTILGLSVAVGLRDK